MKATEKCEITRQALESGKIIHTGWNLGREIADQCGVNVVDYFNVVTGEYLGPDCNGLEPVFEVPGRANNKVTVDGNVLIQTIGVEHSQAILNVLGIDLDDVTESLRSDCEWHCGVEDRWWPITGKQLSLTDEYAVRWTHTEAGVDDIEIIERIDDESDLESLAEWLEEIAVQCGSCDGDVRVA